MKALILAAGLGTRLAPITDNYPKCMTEIVDGKTIIAQQINNLLSCNIKDIVVITGYKSEVLSEYLKDLYKDIHIIENKDYKVTNNMYSAYLSKDYIANSDFIMMNADVFFDLSVLQSLLNDVSQNAIITDIGTWMEESMKVIEHNGKLVDISKTISRTDALGCSIDIYKFSSEAGKLFFDKCNEYINVKNILNVWSEVAIKDILDECNFKVSPLNGRWFEIDTHEDLKKARELFVSNRFL